MIHDQSTTALARKLQKLEEENALLQERIAYLTGALGQHKICPPEWGLSITEQRIFQAIEAKEYASRDDLMAAVYWDKDEPAVPHSIHVFMSRLRKKIKPFGIEIGNLYGAGFYIKQGRTA